jgi:hypothetical protein
MKLRALVRDNVKVHGCGTQLGHPRLQHCLTGNVNSKMATAETGNIGKYLLSHV